MFFDEMFGNKDPEPKVKSNRAFAKALLTMEAGFNRGVPDFANEETVKIWVWAFREYDDDVFRLACKEAVLTLDWFPAIAELRKICDRLTIEKRQGVPSS